MFVPARTVLYSAGQIAAAVDEHGFLPTPVNPDTRLTYSYALVLPQQAVLFADSIEDLVDGLIPGYSDMDDDTAAEARILYCGHAAAYLQAQAVMAADPAQVDALTDTEYAAVMAPRLGPDAPLAPLWKPDLPLFTVTTSYEPYTVLTRPASYWDGVPGKTGNLVVIDPTDPEQMLLTLHRAGMIRVLHNDDRPDRPF